METFIKKYWDEEDILFYLHFNDEEAARQIEITKSGKVFLSQENPFSGEAFLYDQSLSDFDFDQDDIISKEEFEIAWNSK
ncbi:MAG: hypothetical protein M0D57_13365 [Sphingobacteriales bacterium JAD_PAG50586_3]|nr:MAG: hypothetical protein M0D57_13365 [Sphingobacteriales bacterium JAD_PAG50586_3]